MPAENVEAFNARTADGGTGRMSMLDGTILRENESSDDTITLEYYLPGLEQMKKLRETLAERFPENKQ